MPTATKARTSASAAPARPKLLLIDGHSVAYRAFFALPVENFSTKTGQHTNGVFGFTSMLINVLRDEAPTHVGVAFDVSRQTFQAGTSVDGQRGSQSGQHQRLHLPARPVVPPPRTVT